MSRTFIRPSLLLLFCLPWLTGCSVFNLGQSSQLASPVIGVAAQNLALQEQIRDGHGGQPDVFVPLAKAKAAVEAARAQPKVQQTAADVMAQARAELSKAQQLWAADDARGHDDMERLAQVYSHAHAARRLAQIARYTALREINLARLQQANAQLRAANDKGQAAAKTSLVGDKVVPGQLGSFSFKPGTARLLAESRTTVINLSDLLKAHADVGVVILGYTDNSEPAESALRSFKQANPKLQNRGLSHEQLLYAYHMALSSARARSAARALVQAGIAPRRIGARGYGSSRPIASNETAEGRAANERVVAIIVAGPDSKNSPLAGGE